MDPTQYSWRFLGFYCSLLLAGILVVDQDNA
jgi:hypothetical protein